jgi:phosphoribosylformimino-5-aminoimidazole carboxamide ribotide isomerase
VILFPAIDLKDGQAVRLLRGDMNQATVFNPDPVAQALTFMRAGFEWLHLVDLNGAFAGKPVNEAAVKKILTVTDLPIQLGGGLRDLDTIEHWLALGVTRVILGTAAVKDPELVRAACRKFPGRVVVGIDARGGRVAVEGWAEESDITAGELALRFADAGVVAIVHTDIDRDGALGGVNVEATRDLAATVPLPIIASGGVSSLDDIAGLMAADPEPNDLRPTERRGGIAGAVIGRALYDGRIHPASALALVRGVEDD